MRYVFLIAVFFSVWNTSCTSGKKTGASQQQNAPTWVSSRPIDPAFYIGIGSVNKRVEPVSFAEAARKNALSNLASEISVTVRSESFLNTMQVNQQVQEVYNQTIATTADERIEGYELVDIYETPNDYFVFYRLSKAQHESIRRQRKMSTMQGAYDQLLQARNDRNRANIVLAADQYLHGLFELQEYWNDANPWNDAGTEIFLDNTLFREFRQMVAEVELSASTERVILNSGNRFREEVIIRAAYNGQPVRGLKLNFSYDNGRFRNEQNGETDNNGELRIVLERVNIANASNNLRVQLNVDQFRPADLERRLVNPMTENLRTSPLIIPIVAEMPVVHLQSNERNLGANLNNERLSAPLRERLDARGFQFTDLKNKADYTILVEADTRSGGTAQGFHVAYLDLQITVRDQKGNILFQRSESNVKGLQLNFEAAGLESYRTGVRQIEREIADALIDALL